MVFPKELFSLNGHTSYSWTDSISPCSLGRETNQTILAHFLVLNIIISGHKTRPESKKKHLATHSFFAL